MPVQEVSLCADCKELRAEMERLGMFGSSCA